MEREQAACRKRGRGRPPKNSYKDHNVQIEGFQFPSSCIPKRKRSKTWKLGTKVSLYDDGETHMRLHQYDELGEPHETSGGHEVVESNACSLSSSNKLVHVDVECVGKEGSTTCSSSLGKRFCQFDVGCDEKEGLSTCSSSSSKTVLRCDDGCGEIGDDSTKVDAISCSSSFFEDLDLPCLSQLEVPGPIPSSTSMYCDAGLFLDFFDDVPTY